MRQPAWWKALQSEHTFATCSSPEPGFAGGEYCQLAAGQIERADFLRSHSPCADVDEPRRRICGRVVGACPGESREEAGVEALDIRPVEAARSLGSQVGGIGVSGGLDGGRSEIAMGSQVEVSVPGQEPAQGFLGCLGSNQDLGSATVHAPNESAAAVASDPVAGKGA